MPLSLLIKKILSALALPPLMPLLCIVIGLALARRKPRLGYGFAWAGLAMIWLTSTPAILDLMVKPLENVPVLQEKDLARAEAIVILGAGYHRHMPEYGGPVPNRLALERLRFGARLAHFSGLPVMVSGEAEVMAESLYVDFGLAPRWLEGESLDTADNARFSANILRNEGIRRIALVTHAAHMRRSIGEFASQGIEVIPAPTGFLGDYSTDDGEMRGEDLFDYLPGPSAAFASWFVIHEWAGILAQRIRLAVAGEGSVRGDAVK
jgi:uncharacterized SAM-binding protein YcdF (DUF218 family)